jgi:2-iminoacetate synthase ThiH
VESYLGGEDQAPDELIESIEGIGTTPAYRDHAYLRFDTMDLSRYGMALLKGWMAMPRTAVISP